MYSKVKTEETTDPDPPNLLSFNKDEYTSEDLMEMVGTTGWWNYFIIFVVLSGK